MSRQFLLAGTTFPRTSLACDDLDSLRSTGWVFCRRPLSLGLSDVSLMLRWELGFGEDGRGGKGPISALRTQGAFYRWDSSRVTRTRHLSGQHFIHVGSFPLLCLEASH